MFNKIIVSFFAFLFSGFLYAQNQSLNIQIKKLSEAETPGKQIAVFIAINKYKNWNPLKETVKDAEEIRKVLMNRYYVDYSYSLYDEKATKKNILGLFQKLQNDLKPNDSLLIFYAGHGHLDKVSQTGFWIPVDGGIDPLEQDRWIANIIIRGLISNIKAKHILLISDSCFSGDILNTSRSSVSQISGDYFKKAYERRARQVLSSGSSEVVPDQSLFAQQLKLALEENNKPYLDPLMLFNEIRLGIKDSTPLLGDLKGTGHQDGGSFLFFLKEPIDQQTVVMALDKQNNREEEVAKEKNVKKKTVNNEENGEGNTHNWFLLGFGGGAGEGGKGNDYSALGYGIAFSHQSGQFIMSARLAGVTELSLLGEPVNDAGDLSLLAGFCAKKRYIMFSIAGGLGYVHGTHAVKNEFTGNVSEDKFDTVGLALEAQAFLTPFKFAGIGIYGYANLNPEKLYYGILIALQFGNLW